MPKWMTTKTNTKGRQQQQTQKQTLIDIIVFDYALQRIVVPVRKYNAPPDTRAAPSNRTPMSAPIGGKVSMHEVTAYTVHG